ncbi:hypothetical protein EUC41_31195 [Achromobacter denitrificans]|jgi:hypothetical protein|uniref:Uncharacterized protein n=1 Tax=Achromobacter denitrificans TaxID=32002 RepID=A0A6N0JMY8_ACHDE|nr:MULTISPECIES: hypothetical protein [Achromobacter]MDX3878129.1 hypothetical protein [Achromobacter sp.]MDF3939586.1 hypothetical protein [Achromobacter denitrificans]QCS64421.1 hypothetical protein EC609_19190 [Achromobacter denitrificans]QKQ48493.1 hypothetical protein FOC81_18050 [Achromobacter denitrificans]QQE57465.1 hypothetical protein I6H41_32125 [Achromobacter xylosoxidans]
MMSAANNQKDKGPAAAKLVAAVVARGRTLLVDDGKSLAAGEEIELPAAEVERLRQLGFLEDPEAPVIRRDNGPRFGSAAGPQIRRG